MTKADHIAAALRQEISDTRVPAGTPLPGVRAVAQRFAAAPVTADRALAMLAADGVIVRKPRRGSFVRLEPECIPAIALVATINDPVSVVGTKLLCFAPRYCWDRLQKLRCKCVCVNYHSLLNCPHTQQSLANFDAILLSRSMLDEKTVHFLKPYENKIVLFDHEGAQNMLACSEVVPDFLPGLRHAFSSIMPENYRRVICVCADHDNAAGRMRCIDGALAERHSIPEIHLTVRSMRGDSGQMSAYRAFQTHAAGCAGALIVSTSDYLSFGIVEALKDNGLTPGKTVSLLSMDNVESYGVTPFPEYFLSSVDMEKSIIAAKSVELAMQIARQHDNCRYKINVPAKSILRHSAIINTTSKES